MACCLMAADHELNNVDLLSVKSSDIHTIVILLEITYAEISFKITYLNYIQISQGPMS